MVILDTIDQALAALEVLKTHDHIVIPVFTDVHRHPVDNTLCLLYYAVLNGDSYVYVVNHSEGQSPRGLLSDFLNLPGYTPDAKIMRHLNAGAQWATLDINGMEFLQTGKVIDRETFIPASLRQFYRAHWREKIARLNVAAPLMKLIEFCEDYAAHLKTVMKVDPATIPGYYFHNHCVIPVTWFLEKSGIHVERAEFFTRHPDQAEYLTLQNLFYTEYNPYTTTGRITSRFAGWNTSAIPKADGSRKYITSRFPKGAMMALDYESFHLRLIGKMIGYDLPSGSLHEYFGKQYFGVSELTAEQYEESKGKTFHNLYSNSREGQQIPFFAKVYEFTDTLWTNLQKCGTIISLTGREIRLADIENPSKAKVFNYFLQLREMEVTMATIRALIPVFSSVRSKPVLYTYDALLIDLDMTDGKDFVLRVVEVMENDGAYPVRVYVGKNYDDLTNVTATVKTNCVGVI